MKKLLGLVAVSILLAGTADAAATGGSTTARRRGPAIGQQPVIMDLGLPLSLQNVLPNCRKQSVNYWAIRHALALTFGHHVLQNILHILKIPDFLLYVGQMYDRTVAYFGTGVMACIHQVQQAPNIIKGKAQFTASTNER